MTKWICKNFHKLIVKNLRTLKKSYKNEFYLQNIEFLKFILAFLKDIAKYLKLHTMKSRSINAKDEE